MPASVKNLIICVHSHQPIGNFDWVIQDAYEKSYRPFFEVLDHHPGILVSCHFSGSLMDWLEKHKPEFITLLRRMSDRGQLEFIGGGYYEPIYGAIPKKDLAGQIEMMRNKLKILFGKYPEGAWLTERVWDPDLVKPLKKAQVEFTILDDFHLEKAGAPSPVTGYYQARDGKEVLDLFSSMKDLRYLMPFRLAEETLNYLHKAKAGPNDCFVFADDCEKFGLWPGTYNWVYGQGWLEKLFTLLENDESIRTTHFGTFRASQASKGEVNVTHSSYSEMMEWSGGRFYNFFTKYPESEYMRDRMWQVSEAVESARAANMPSPILSEARELLFKSQCNCSYWHGVFGGLYLHHLRSAVFENLIKAEDVLRSQTNHRPASGPAMIERIELKSGSRVRVVQKKIVSYINPGYGAALEELDHLPKAVNLMCNLQRRKEHYHEKIVQKSAKPKEGGILSIHDMLGSKDKDLEKHLQYDTNRRLSFLDHFFAGTVGLEDFKKSAYKECGDFLTAVYKETPRKPLLFKREGSVRLSGKKTPLTLEKSVSAQGESSLRVDYRIENDDANEATFTFGVEFNFSIGEEFAMKGLEEKAVREWIFNDSWRGIKIRLSSSEEMTLLAAPIETVSESESGLEKTYQELAVLLQRSITLKPGKSAAISIELGVSA